VTPRARKPSEPPRQRRDAGGGPRGRAGATKTRRPPGRPSKLSEDAIAQIESLIRAGATVEVAAQAAGVSRGTIYRWLKQGEKARAGTIARRLRDRVERARAESETVLVARIAQAAGKGSWQAAAWLLERRFPERWMKPTERPLPEAPAAAAADDNLDEDPFADVVDLAKRRRR
jgi:transposase